MIMKSTKHRGFSLLELLIVVSIGLTMASISFIAMKPLFNENHVDQAYDTTLSVMRNYRNQSITANLRYIVTFTAPGTLTVQRWDYALPVSPAPVTVATYTLPSDIQFAVQAGFPNPGSRWIRHRCDRHGFRPTAPWAARTTSDLLSRRFRAG